MDQKCVVTLGEIMLRLSPPDNKRFLQAQSYNATFAGSEANVAVSVANLGMNAKLVTKVPLNELGQAAVNSLRSYGVNTDYIVRDGERIGVFYLEKGASQRPSKVIYDRKNSAFSLSNPEEYDWNAIFSDANWFHFSGITPALSEDVIQICKQACKAAKDAGIIVSCDLNYRNKLWTKEHANEVMSDLMQYVDVCFANESDISDVFGIELLSSSSDNGVLNREDYARISKELLDKFKLKKVIISLRTAISANDNMWSSMLNDGDFTYFAEEYKVHIVDRVGSGDSLAAAFIYATLRGFDDKQALEFATAASCLNHSIEGDFNIVTADEVLNLMHGNKSGRIVR